MKRDDKAPQVRALMMAYTDEQRLELATRALCLAKLNGITQLGPLSVGWGKAATPETLARWWGTPLTAVTLSNYRPSFYEALCLVGDMS